MKTEYDADAAFLHPNTGRTGTPLFYALMLRSRGKKSLAAIRTWYNIVRYYTSADLRPTRGRTISLANHAHPPEGKRINALSMSEGHGIISSDIIPALICVRPEGGQFLWRPVCTPRREHVRRTWYNNGNISRKY